MILGALTVIALAVASTMVFSGVLLFSSARDQAGYRHVTLTDAVLQCQSATREEFKNSVTNVELDDLSTRFDAANNRYKVFFKAQRPAAGANETGYYIACHVSAADGRITNFEGSASHSSPTEALRRQEGGLFGWPMN